MTKDILSGLRALALPAVLRAASVMEDVILSQQVSMSSDGAESKASNLLSATVEILPLWPIMPLHWPYWSLDESRSLQPSVDGH